MTTWIALLRGINVGGNNIVPMAELRTALEAAGLRRVRTWIQSGNVVFESNARTAAPLSKKISDCILKQYGFRPHVHTLRDADLQAAVDANPFPEAVTDPKTLHFSFLQSPATNARLDAITEAKTASERFALTDHVFYLHAPDGIGRSRLAANVESWLGVAATGRNYRTVDKLCSLAADSTP